MSHTQLTEFVTSTSWWIGWLDRWFESPTVQLPNDASAAVKTTTAAAMMSWPLGRPQLTDWFLCIAQAFNHAEDKSRFSQDENTFCLPHAKCNHQT